MRKSAFFLILFMGYGLFFFDAAGAQTAPPEPAWETRFEGYPVKVVTDGAGNTYVTGLGLSFSGDDFQTAKYDPNGNQLWVARYDYTADYDFDRPTDLTVDSAGNVYVTGESSGGFATVKYDSGGNQLWVQRYGTNAVPAALAVDGTGNVYVTGYGCVWSAGAYGGGCEDHDYFTFKYAPDGTQLWLRTYDQGSNLRPTDTDKAYALALDGLGHVYVSGYSRSSSTTVEIATVKYDAGGNQLWVKRDPGASSPTLAVDAAGRLHVADSRYSGVNFDLVVFKYDTDGTTLWERTYDNGYIDLARDIAVDALGNVYVAGASQSNEGGRIDRDYVTLKYDAAGGLVWAARHDNVTDTSYAGATRVAVDASGNVFVTGTGTSASQGVTIKYSPAGSEVWTVESGADIALDGEGNLVVTGIPGEDSTEYLTRKYELVAPADFSLSSVPTFSNVQPGDGSAHTVTVTSTNNFSGMVSLTCSVFPAEPMVGCSLFPASVTLPVNGSAASTLTLTTVSSTPVGSYTVTVTGQSGSQTASAAATLGVSNSDLSMTQLTPATASIRVGESLSITDTVSNLGSAGAGAFKIEHRLSVNAVFGDADDVYDFSDPLRAWGEATPIVYQLIPGLAGGGSATETLSLFIHDSIQPGEYYLCAKADADSYVIEFNEANNVLCTPVTITLPDLVVTSVTAGAISVNAGSPLSVTVTIENVGGSAPPGLFTSGVYLSTDNQITASDALVASLTTTALPPGENESKTIVVTIPAGQAPGVYYLGAIADPGNGVLEDVESNNSLAGSQITVTAGSADLVVAALSGPADAASGGTITLSSTVANQGAGSPTRDFFVRFHLSSDAVITESDFGLGGRPVGPLPAGGASSESTMVSIPAGLPAGVYYLGAIADPGHQVPEGDEGNNAFTGSTITITSGAQSFTPAAAWAARYAAPGGTHDIPLKVLSDDAGQIYVLGKANSTSTNVD
ncbi:MAG: CARDB domain-containing protein, partial [Nitrospirota bacterium]